MACLIKVKVIKVKQNITCKDDYVLYVLSCTKQGCMAQYAGLTSRNANTRFSEHLASTMDPNTTCPVGHHWQVPGHRTIHPSGESEIKTGPQSGKERKI